MNPILRPLPATIAVIAILVGVKTFDLAKNVGLGTPALANTAAPPRAAATDAKPGPVKHDAPAADPTPVEDHKPAADAGCGERISETERTALQDLRARRKQLEARGVSLDEREAVLGAAEKRLTERVQQLTVLQGKLETLEKQRREREDADWKELVKTYEVMKPRDAANIFNDLDNKILIQVLDRMKPAKAAAVLAAMAPERARGATIQLAKFREQVSAAPQLGSAGGAPQ